MSSRWRSRVEWAPVTERRKVATSVGSSHQALAACMRVAEDVRDVAEDNILAAFSVTGSKGGSSKVLFEQELTTMLAELQAFPAKIFARRANIGQNVPKELGVAIVSYGTGVGPVYGSLWEFGISGVSSLERPQIAALGRAADTVDKGLI